MKIGLNTHKRQQTAAHIILKLVMEYTLKYKQPGKWDLKWRACNRIVCIECNGDYLHIENQATGKTIDPEMSRTLCMNGQLSCGMLTQSLAEPSL